MKPPGLGGFVTAAYIDHYMCSFLFPLHYIAGTYYNLLVHSPVRGHLGYFQFGATMNKAVMNKLVPFDFLSLLLLFSSTLSLPWLVKSSCLNLPGAA